MYFLYSILLTLGFFVLLPRFVFDAFNSGKYAEGFWQRFGFLPHFVADNRRVLWIHCVSVGEANAAIPLVAKIRETYPELRIVVSTTTKTGQSLAKSIYSDYADLIFYFPIDWKFTVRRVLRRLNPSFVLLMETEIWFNFIREADRCGADIFIVNGRLSQKSFDRYLYIQKFMKRVLGGVDLALMQDEADAERIQRLGVSPEKIEITGNIKFDQNSEGFEIGLTEKFRARFGVTSDRPLIIAASTHEPEEQLILEAFRLAALNVGALNPRLLFAPRHPERFEKVAALIKDSTLSFARRSHPTNENDQSATLILLDSVGELRSVLPLGELVFVGGSLIPHGGQNVLEPASAEKAIVTGFYTDNFKAIIREFLANDALIQIPESDQNAAVRKLADVFSQLLLDGEKRERMANRAFEVMKKNRGATDKTISHLTKFFSAQENSEGKALK